MIGRALLASVLVACSSSSPTPFAPVDAGADAAIDAGPACTTIFSEDFREGLGPFTRNATDGNVDVQDGYLRGTLASMPAVAGSSASASTIAAIPADTKSVRVFYTSQVGTWPRDARATVGCTVALDALSVLLELETGAGPTEDQMTMRLGGKTIEGIVGAGERHVVAVVVERASDPSFVNVDLLWDGVSRGRLNDVVLNGAFDEVMLTCGIVAVKTPPMASAEPPFAAVDDVSVSACK